MDLGGIGVVEDRSLSPLKLLCRQAGVRPATTEAVPVKFFLSFEDGLGIDKRFPFIFFDL